MDTDGILLHRRRVLPGDSEPPSETSIWTALLIQSEFSTSQTKPNPLGKAFVTRHRYGVWVDTVDGERVRLTSAIVLFIVPQAAAIGPARLSATALQNVKNAVVASEDARFLEVPLGISAAELARELGTLVRAILKGPGRPRTVTGRLNR